MQLVKIEKDKGKKSPQKPSAIKTPWLNNAPFFQGSHFSFICRLNASLHSDISLLFGAFVCYLLKEFLLPLCKNRHKTTFALPKRSTKNGTFLLWSCKMINKTIMVPSFLFKKKTGQMYKFKKEKEKIEVCAPSEIIKWTHSRLEKTQGCSFGRCGDDNAQGHQTFGPVSQSTPSS